MRPHLADNRAQFALRVNALGERNQSFQLDLMALARGNFARNHDDAALFARANAAQGRLEPVEIAVFQSKAVLDAPDARARERRRIFDNERPAIFIGHMIEKYRALKSSHVEAGRNAKRRRNVNELAFGVEFADQIEARIGDGAVTLGARLRRGRERMGRGRSDQRRQGKRRSRRFPDFARTFRRSHKVSAGALSRRQLSCELPAPKPKLKLKPKPKRGRTLLKLKNSTPLFPKIVCDGRIILSKNLAFDKSRLIQILEASLQKVWCPTS